MEAETCQFEKAWLGKCKNPLPCAEHSTLECCSCGAPATHNCDETGQFVCGAALCDNCEHRTFPDGTNGGVGFNAQKYDGPTHIPKSEQKHKPWYEQDEKRMQVNTGRELLESMFKAIIAEHGFTDVALALHNACAHGKCFGSIQEEQLQKLFSEVLEPMVALAKEIEGT